MTSPKSMPAWAKETKHSHGSKKPMENRTAALSPLPSIPSLMVSARTLGSVICSGASSSPTNRTAAASQTLPSPLRRCDMSLPQRILGLAGKVPVHAQDFQSRPHVSRIHKRDSAWYSCHKLVLHVVRINDFWRRSRFRTENLRHPKLLKFRFRHLINHSQHHIPLPGHRRANQQHHRQLCVPVLPLAEQDLAHIAKAKIAYRCVRIHHHCDVRRSSCLPFRAPGEQGAQQTCRP